EIYNLSLHDALPILGAQKSHEKRHIRSHKTEEVHSNDGDERRRARAQPVKEILGKSSPHLTSRAIHSAVSHLKAIGKQNFVAAGDRKSTRLNSSHVK